MYVNSKVGPFCEISPGELNMLIGWLTLADQTGDIVLELNRVVRALIKRNLIGCPFLL